MIRLHTQIRREVIILAAGWGLILTERFFSEWDPAGSVEGDVAGLAGIFMVALSFYLFSRRVPISAPVLRILLIALLVVDDNPDNTALIGHMLRNQGATVTIANSGRRGIDEALAATQRGQSFSAILMDINMPIIDGYDATRELRSLDVRTPVIALTAYATENDRQACLDAGCDAFLRKPVTRIELVTAILRQLDDETSAENLPQPQVILSAARSESTPSSSSEGFESILRMYRDSLRKQFRVLSAMASGADWESAGKVAHRIAGTAGGYGYPELSDLARECEESVRAGANTEQTRATVEKLCAALDEALAEGS